jgi:hypothetical protein
MRDQIKEQLDKHGASTQWMPPTVLDLRNESDVQALSALLEQGKIFAYTDTMESAIEELYDIEFPHEKDVSKEQKSQFEEFAKRHEWPAGKFVFYPWSGRLVRMPDEKDLRRLRTSRNRNLISVDEQLKLYGSTIFIAGLSVGSNIVEALVSMGIGNKFIIADMDIIEPSNLNRIRSPFHHVGTHKADAIAMRMSEIDPYLKFDFYRDGLTEANMLQILDTKPDVIVDEMDQLPLKVKMRRQAQERKLPVVSAADDGDSALLDIERYDLNPDYPLLHGHVPAEVLSMLETGQEIPREKLGLVIGKYFVGSENIPLRMYQSLGEVGKSLPSWPQLGGAAAQSGIAIAYATRKIVLGQPLNSGRFVIGPEDALDPTLHDPEHQAQLAQFQAHLDSFNV